MILRQLTTPTGERVTVAVTDSLGGNLFIVFRDRVLVVAQDTPADEDELALAAWESAPPAPS